MADFFKILWRINAVLAFVALVALFALVGLIVRERIDGPLLASFLPPPPAATAIKPKTHPAAVYTLEKDMLVGAEIEHEDLEVYRLERWGKAKGEPATAEAAATVNLLLVDRKAGTTHWLFAGFNRAIVTQDAVLTGRWYWHEPEVDDNVPVELAVLKVIDADTDGDGVLSSADRQSLYVVRFGAPAAPEKLLTADAIWFTQQKAKEYQVGYREHGEGFLATYALPDFTLTSKLKVEGLPK
jgi:hypothetical protein